MPLATIKWCSQTFLKTAATSFPLHARHSTALQSKKLLQSCSSCHAGQPQSMTKHGLRCYEPCQKHTSNFHRAETGDPTRPQQSNTDPQMSSPNPCSSTTTSRIPSGTCPSSHR